MHLFTAEIACSLQLCRKDVEAFQALYHHWIPWCVQIFLFWRPDCHRLPVEYLDGPVNCLQYLWIVLGYFVLLSSLLYNVAVNHSYVPEQIQMTWRKRFPVQFLYDWLRSKQRSMSTGKTSRKYDIRRIANRTRTSRTSAKPNQTPPNTRYKNNLHSPMLSVLLPVLLTLLPLVVLYLTNCPNTTETGSKPAKMVEHEEEPKRFSPKVPVELAPPKYDPIDAEELAKCDGTDFKYLLAINAAL